MLNKCKNKNNSNIKHECSIEDLYNEIVKICNRTANHIDTINNKTETIENLHSLYKSDPCGFKELVINEIISEKEAVLENIGKANELIDIIYDNNHIKIINKHQQKMDKVRLHVMKQEQYINKNTNFLNQVIEEICDNTKNIDNNTKKVFNKAGLIR